MKESDGWHKLWVLLLAAAALAVGIRHGLPDVHVPDTHIIRNALGMAQSGNLWPASGTYSTYPYFLAYLLLPLYGATFVLGKMLGFYPTAEAFGRSVIMDPTVVYLEARILIAFFGLIAVFYLFRTARRLGMNPTGAACAALLLAFNPLFVQLGHHARPWVPLVAGLTFTLYHSLGITSEGRRRDYLFAALGAGITFAMHQVGGVALLLPLGAHLARAKGTLFSGKAIRTLFSIVLLFAVAAFILGYSHELFGGAGKEVIATKEKALDLGGQKLLLENFSGALAGKVAWAFFGYDPVLALVGLVGLAAALFSGRLKGLRFALALFFLFNSVFFLLHNGTHIRYFLPIVPVLALGAAHGLCSLSRRIGLREVWLMLPLILFSAVQTGRMDYLLCQVDTRDQARAWIEANLKPGTRIAAEGYTATLQPDRSSLQFLQDEAGIWLKRREKIWLNDPVNGDSGPPFTYYMIPLERFYEYTSYWPHQYLHGGERPIQAFLDDLEAEWLMLSDRWPRYERHAPLVDYMAQAWEPGPLFSPAREPDPPEATLPTDMDFPLTSLWICHRPGPVIRLFKKKP